MKRHPATCGWVIATAWLAAAGSPAANVAVTCIYTNGRVETRTEALAEEGSTLRFRWASNDIPAGVRSIEVLPDFATATKGEPGYFVMPNGEVGGFHEQDGERTARNSMPMPIFGMKNPRATFVAIVTGLPHDYTLVTRAKAGQYRIFPRFELNGLPAPGDIAIEYRRLPGDQADYSGMARAYRAYQLGRKACIPLAERIGARPELAYAAKAIEVRVRLGWKPMPSPVEQQTRATEPPMKVAVTFDRAGDILDEFRRQGIDRAEICLVGWNRKGHDGRFPEIFPVEEALGGEAGLRRLIAKAQGLGFQIVCHSNSSDAYRIADTWDEEYIIKKPDGSASTHAVYSGGRMYDVCPQRAFERFTPKELREIAALGFRGLHYIDVLTVVQPRACFDPRHPLTRDQGARWVGRMLGDAQQVFGGSASEGGHDFCCGQLDYALYASIVPPKPHPMVDRMVPFWQLVYHGIVMSNPFPPTCNYTIKDPATRLTLVEFGGRPFFYFYSNYRDNNDAWMGKEDLTCGDDRALAASVAKIKEGHDEYQRLARLQTEFMDRHETVAPDVVRAVYSDGTEIVCNYRATPYEHRGAVVQPYGYLVVEPARGADRGPRRPGA